MNYNDFAMNPKGDLFATFRNYLIDKEIITDEITCYMDSREPIKNKKYLVDLGYDVIVKQLEISDYLFEGGIAFERKNSDFIKFSDVLQKSMELKKAFKHPYLIVEQDIEKLISYKSFYGKTPIHVVRKQFYGLISSLIVRGITPIFAGTTENLYNIMDGIVRKHLDGKDRENDYKIEGFRIDTDDDRILAMYMNIGDIGYETAWNLKEVYPNFEKLLKASINDLMNIDGIGEKRANNIYNILHK